MKLLTASVLILAFSAPLSAAKPSLWNLQKIDQGLFDIGVAYGIKQNCGTIKEHKMRAASFAWSLVNYAKSKGYTTKEVRAFIDSPTEKAKLRARVTKYLKDKGLNPDKTGALCAMGLSEISKGSQVGKLLRVK